MARPAVAVRRRSSGNAEMESSLGRSRQPWGAAVPLRRQGLDPPAGDAEYPSQDPASIAGSSPASSSAPLIRARQASECGLAYGGELPHRAFNRSGEGLVLCGGGSAADVAGPAATALRCHRHLIVSEEPMSAAVAGAMTAPADARISSLVPIPGRRLSA